MYFTKQSSIVCETKPCCVGETLFEVKGPGLIPFVTFSSEKRHVLLCTAIRCVQSHLLSLVLNTDPQLLPPFRPLAFGPEHTLLSYSNRTECRAAQVPVESRFSFSRATVTSIGLFTREEHCLTVGLLDTEIWRLFGSPRGNRGFKDAKLVASTVSGPLSLCWFQDPFPVMWY